MFEKNNKSKNSFIGKVGKVSLLKTAALSLLILSTPTSSFAGKALNYGDMEDETWAWVDHRYVKVAAGDVRGAAKNVDHQNKNTVKMSTKKISANKLSEKELAYENQTGYGDEAQD